MIKEVTLFTLIKHRINNTGWIMKWRWNGRVERSANPNIERMLNVFDLHLSTPVPEFIDPVFMKTSPKRSISMTENEHFGLVFKKAGSVISGTEEKAVSRICPSKTRRNMQTFGWCLQFSQSCYTILLLSAENKAGKINTRRVMLRKDVSEKLSIINPLWRRRRPFANWNH